MVRKLFRSHHRPFQNLIQTQPKLPPNQNPHPIETPTKPNLQSTPKFNQAGKLKELTKKFIYNN